MPRFYFVVLLMLAISGSVLSQAEVPALRRTVPRDLLHNGCRHTHASVADLAAMRAASSANIDMTESLARSDSFDVLHYGLELDVTTANIQQVSGAATVTFETLEAGATQLWFDLTGSLEVSEVELDGAPWPYVQAGDTIAIEAPAGGWLADGPDEVHMVYAGQPGKDPYWGGMYLTTNYIYSLGIGLTSIPPNHGKA